MVGMTRYIVKSKNEKHKDVVVDSYCATDAMNEVSNITNIEPNALSVWLEKPRICLDRFTNIVSMPFKGLTLDEWNRKHG